MHEGIEDRGPCFITASAASGVDQGTVLVPAFIAVLLGPNMEVRVDAVLSTLAMLDEPRPREPEDQQRVELVMNVELAVEEEPAKKH